MKLSRLLKHRQQLIQLFLKFYLNGPSSKWIWPVTFNPLKWRNQSEPETTRLKVDGPDLDVLNSPMSLKIETINGESFAKGPRPKQTLSRLEFFLPVKIFTKWLFGSTAGRARRTCGGSGPTDVVPSIFFYFECCELLWRLALASERCWKVPLYDEQNHAGVHPLNWTSNLWRQPCSLKVEYCLWQRGVGWNLKT